MRLPVISVFSSDLTVHKQNCAGFISQFEEKNSSRYATFSVSRCVSTRVYPEGGRNHYPGPSIVVLSSDQSLKGHGFELQSRQMGNIWASNTVSGSPAMLLPSSDLATLLLQSFRWSNAGHKNSI